MNTNDRENIIVRTSIIGIIANIILVAFKAFVGLVSGSIAVMLDAVNNLSDAISSLVTIVGTKLAAKAPDKKHPLGYGRIEFLSALVVAAIVLYAGITSFTESVKKILSPEAADYSIVSIVIIASAVVIKILLGLYVVKQGKATESGALEASGHDALFDAVLSFSVLASALVYVITGLSLEAFVGLVISVFIIKSGLEMISETLDDIIGKRADVETVRKIKKLIKEEPEVRGAYDLVITSYGPNKDIASVHIELPDTMSVDEVDKITRRIEAKVFKETGIILTGVGVYAYNTGDNEARKIEGEVRRIVRDHEWTIQLHGFNVDIENKTMRFDVVISFDIERKEAYSILIKELEERFKDYKIDITLDVDLTDV
ncbi:MAG: cation diffusion facilitator family transporter [Sphaerochaetaceae bacterium]|nr:cation diffusion facilitator family transporter [Sphaerochaetaceae bacterium]